MFSYYLAAGLGTNYLVLTAIAPTVWKKKYIEAWIKGRKKSTSHKNYSVIYRWHVLQNNFLSVTGMDCHYSVWGVLAFLSLALIFSLILNISHYMKKKREGKQHYLWMEFESLKISAENAIDFDICQTNKLLFWILQLSFD